MNVIANTLDWNDDKPAFTTVKAKLFFFAQTFILDSVEDAETIF